jgi:hypothetical protein
MLHLLGKLAYFAVLGFVAIVLVGPVVGVVGTLLPFAIVGGLVYAGYRSVDRMVRGKRKTLRELDVAPVVIKRPEPIEVKRPEPVAAKVREETPRPGRLRRVGRVMQEMVCGALVAGSVAAAFTWQSPGMGETVGAALLAGAVVGFVVGRSVPEGEKPAALPACAGESC